MLGPGDKVVSKIIMVFRPVLLGTKAANRISNMGPGVFTVIVSMCHVRTMSHISRPYLGILS